MASVSKNQSSCEELTNTKYPCSLCLELLRDKRISFSHNGRNGWERLTDPTIQNCAILHPEQDLPCHYQFKDLCGFCAHLRVDRLMLLSEPELMHFQFPDSTALWSLVVEVQLGTISDIQAKQDHCSLCHNMTEIATREGLSDASDQVIMKARAEHSIEFFVMDAENRLRQVAKFEHDHSGILRFRNYYREHFGDFNYFVSNPHIQGLIDWGKVQGWFDPSISEELILSNPPSEFRVIDVQDQCVVQMSRPCEYICLSYVWGGDSSFQATLQTISDLERPKSLASPDLPRTIKHAMIACAALGKRYLWVDRLCILQDEQNNPSKLIQIEAMADIYGSAYLTFVALEGDSASYGLHGVSPDLKRVALYEMWIGGEMFYEEVPTMQSLSSESMWQKRGWTYQEGILSPRLLVFTKYGLFCERSDCDIQHDHTSEDGCKLVKHDFLPQVFSRSSEPPQFLLPQSTTLDTLSTVGGAIFQRKFGHEGDIVNALVGIMDVVYGKGNHRFGMPLEGIESTICWTVSSPGTPRQARGEAIFPSWSWVSTKTKDPPDFDTHTPCSHISVSIASWGFQDNSQPLGVRWLPPITPSNMSVKNYYDPLKTFLWKHGCVYTGDPRFSDNKTVWKYAELARYGLRAKLAFSRHGHDSNPSFTLNQNQAAQVDTSILCYSQTATLCLRDHTDSWFAFYYQNYRIGRLKLDTESEDATAREMVQSGSASIEALALFAGWSLYGDEDSNLDLDALWEDFNLPKLFYSEKLYERRSKNSEEHFYDDFDLTVMAIRTTDGISRRLGVGKIPLLVWLKLLKPKFRSIVLQ